LGHRKQAIALDGRIEQLEACSKAIEGLAKNDMKRLYAVKVGHD
jgi:hypothetical protein